MFTVLLAFQLTFLRLHLLSEHHHLGGSSLHDALTGTLTDPHAWTMDDTEHRPHHAVEHQISLAGRPRPVAFVSLALPALPSLVVSEPLSKPYVAVAVKKDPPPDPDAAAPGARAPPVA
ncbi:MAG: hypothetical protein Q8O14_11830 [bacterium]|nr:hypothetical protein [bacterium]